MSQHSLPINQSLQISFPRGVNTSAHAFDTALNPDDKNAFNPWNMRQFDNSSDFFNSSDFIRSFRASGDLFRCIVDSLNLYFTPVIILVGLIGNTLSLLVFAVTHLQRLSSSFYLSSLALADLGFLLGLSVVWLERVNVTLYATDGWCQSVQYLTNVCGFMAMWCVVSFTAERYIIVYHPLHKDTFCTKKKARIVVLCLVIFALVLYSYTLWIYDVVLFFLNEQMCSPLPQYYDIMTIISSIDTLFACVIPSVLIVVLNVRIMIKIHQYQSRQNASTDQPVTQCIRDHHQRHSLLQTSISTMGSMHIKFSSTRVPDRNSSTQWVGTQSTNAQIMKKKGLRMRSHFRTARMLLILSSVFVLLNLPSHAFRVQAFVSRVSGGKLKAPVGKFKWHELFQIVYFLNFAINFFIYSACGRSFRTGLTRLCKRWRYKIVKCWKPRKFVKAQDPVDELQVHNDGVLNVVPKVARTLPNGNS